MVAAERSRVRPRRKRRAPHLIIDRMAAFYTLLLTVFTLKTVHAFGGLPSETFTNITVHLVPRE